MFFGDYSGKTLSRHSLMKAAKERPEGVLRLARYLKLRIEGMSPRQVAKLIRWRLTRQRYYG